MIILTTSMYAQKKFAGIWEGKLDVGRIAIRIVFHFDLQSDGKYTGSMDSPDQGVKGINCDDVSVRGDSIIVQIKKLRGGFNGLMVNDSTLDGNWSQGGKVFPLKIKKVAEVSKSPNRPQTPKPPFNYNVEDIEYDNADKSIHFGATFTYPKGIGPFPTAILISGSGQQDRDETILGHKSFAVIADYLTNRGVAVLRVDDRQMGKSTGDVVNATSEDFANDVKVSLNYLKNRKEVDKKRMGLIGHSEGGLIASIVASRNNDIDFVIMLAGPGVKGEDILVQQNEDILKGDGISAKAASSYGTLYRNMIEDVLAESDTTKLYPKMISDFEKWKANQSDQILEQLKLKRDNSNDNQLAMGFAQGFASQWIKYFIQSDPQPFIEKFNCKVLALNGSKDVQVNAAINLPAIKKALKKSKSPSYETKEIPGLNHLFQHCKKCTVEEYDEIEETFALEALEIMGKWLDKNVK